MYYDDAYNYLGLRKSDRYIRILEFPDNTQSLVNENEGLLSQVLSCLEREKLAENGKLVCEASLNYCLETKE